MEDSPSDEAEEEQEWMALKYQQRCVPRELHARQKKDVRIVASNCFTKKGVGVGEV